MIFDLLLLRYKYIWSQNIHVDHIEINWNNIITENDYFEQI